MNYAITNKKTNQVCHRFEATSDQRAIATAIRWYHTFKDIGGEGTTDDYLLTNTSEYRLTEPVLTVVEGGVGSETEEPARPETGTDVRHNSEPRKHGPDGRWQKRQTE